MLLHCTSAPPPFSPAQAQQAGTRGKQSGGSTHCPTRRSRRRLLSRAGSPRCLRAAVCVTRGRAGRVRAPPAHAHLSSSRMSSFWFSRAPAGMSNRSNHLPTRPASACRGPPDASLPSMPQHSVSRWGGVGGLPQRFGCVGGAAALRLHSGALPALRVVHFTRSAPCRAGRRCGGAWGLLGCDQAAAVQARATCSASQPRQCLYTVHMGAGAVGVVQCRTVPRRLRRHAECSHAASCKRCIARGGGGEGTSAPCPLAEQSARAIAKKRVPRLTGAAARRVARAAQTGRHCGPHAAPPAR